MAAKSAATTFSCLLLVCRRCRSPTSADGSSICNSISGSLTAASYTNPLRIEKWGGMGQSSPFSVFAPFSHAIFPLHQAHKCKSASHRLHLRPATTAGGEQATIREIHHAHRNHNPFLAEGIL